VPENNIMAESENGAADVGTLHRRFLLAELREDERQRLEERLLSDDDLFDEMLAAEDDLVDAAARGELGANERERLAALPGMEQRLAFAHTLAKLVAQRSRSEMGPRRSAWQRWTPWLTTAAVLAVASGLWLVLGFEPQQQGDPQRISRTASFVLPRASLRSAGAELPIDAGIDRVELLLELTENAGEGHFRAVLEEEHATELLSWDELTATRFDWGMAVRIDLPAERLAPGAYSLRLFTDDAPGSPVEIGRYGFTVVRSE